ncbi:hypothetical protein HT031_004241 [Scenedesmus sp. PABB004]|nr:hypothetical protein HT031_004241 [Scenedesmus sp. PABB004]
MGAAASRTYAAAEAAARAAPGAARSAGAVARDAELVAAQQARRAPLSLEEEEALEGKDAELGSLLDRLGGSIQGAAVHVTPTQPLAAAVRSSAGRLPAAAVKELFELQARAAGGPVDASALLAKYKADPQLVAAVLSHACLPELVEASGAAGVEAFAQWPAWFRRRAPAPDPGDDGSS